MLEIKIKFKGKCPKHPRYNPAEGPNGIKGGCLQCWALCDVYMIAEKLQTCIADAEGKLSGEPSQS